MVTRVGRAYRVILVTLVFRVGLVQAHQVIRVGLEFPDTLVTAVSQVGPVDQVILDGLEFLDTAVTLVSLAGLVLVHQVIQVGLE